MASMRAAIVLLLATGLPVCAQESGADLYKRNCAPCHGPNGEGGKGPSLLQLTRGSDAASIAGLITNGIPGAAMPTYDFKPDQVRVLVEWVQRFSADRSAADQGRASRGASIMKGKGGCLRCHTIRGEGGMTGPDLSRVGLNRGVEQLRASLLDPAANIMDRYSMFHWHIPIKNDYLWVRITRRGGGVVEGSRQNEDPFTIQILDADGRVHSFDKADAARIERQPGKSRMPSFRGVLSDDELADVVSYLSGLRGRP